MDTETMIDDMETKSAKPPRRPRGLVNALWVKGLDQAEQLAQVAQRESITPVLLAEELPAGFAASLLAKVGACRAQLELYLSATGDGLSPEKCVVS